MPQTRGAGEGEASCAVKKGNRGVNWPEYGLQPGVGADEMAAHLPKYFLDILSTHICLPIPAEPPWQHTFLGLG